MPAKTSCCRFTFLFAFLAASIATSLLSGQSDFQTTPRQEPAPSSANPINGDVELQSLITAAQQSDAKGDFASSQSEWQLVAVHLERQFGRNSWQALNARLESETAGRQSQFNEEQRQIARDITQLETEAEQAARSNQWQVVLQRMQLAADKTTGLFGPQSHVVARIKVQMGQIAHGNGDPEKAWEYYQSALAPIQETLGINHPESEALSFSIGNLLQINGQTEMALSYLTPCVETSKLVHGESSIIYADRLSALGVAQYETGSIDEAVTTLSSSEAVLRNLNGVENPRYAQTLVDLGLACLASKQNELALQHLQTASDIMKRLLGNSNPATINAMTHLSTALVLNGNSDLAETTLREVLTEQKTGSNSDPVAAARTSFKIAVLAGRKGNLEESERLLREAIAAQQEYLGAAHPDTQRSLTTLASLFENAGRTAEAGQIREYIEQVARQAAPEQETIRR